MRPHLVFLSLSGIFTATSGYAMLWYAWLATAPASPELHAQARLFCNIWTGAFLLGLVFSGGIIWRIFSRRRTARGG